MHSTATASRWPCSAGWRPLAAAVLYIAPAEATLGQGVKLVFLHGALILTGMLGLAVAGLIGLATAITGRDDAGRWALTVGWVAFGMYLAGVATSIPAEIANWGGVYLAEPRMKVAANALALGLIALVANHLLTHTRVKGGLLAAFALYLGWATSTAPMVLHPDNPIGSSPSRAIQFSFAALLVVCVAAAGWIVWRVRRGVGRVDGVAD